MMTTFENCLTNCEDCKRHCIHKGAFRRLPKEEGGLGLCEQLNIVNKGMYKKWHFVENKLGHLINYIERNLNGNNTNIKLAYRIEDNNEEYVYIRFSEKYEKKVCVTADSYYSVVNDVIKAIMY